MEDIIKKRASKRHIVAYVLLALTVITIFVGLCLIREQIQDLALYEQENVSDDKPSDPNSFLYQVIVRMSFIIIIFFVCQVLLRLYRYNILKADHYLAVSDAVALAKNLTSEQKQNFESILTAIITEKVELTVPKSPRFPFATANPKDKGET